MPKAKTSTPVEASKPYSKVNKTARGKNSASLNAEKSANKRTDSHLFTDDNPATTLHGTGFKDAAAAQRTIELVSRRSLLYQFQTINTMYYRAKHHPHSKGNKNMEAAMAVFRKWLDETYPSERAIRPDYKPVIKREIVQRFFERMKSDPGIDESWAQMYVDLPKGKRLANTLMDDAHPEGPDMVTERDEHLTKLTGGRTDNIDEDLWDEEGKTVTAWHLRCIAYAWSPVAESKLKGLT